MRNPGRAIQHRIRYRQKRMAIQMRNQVVLIALKPNCRGIGHPVERAADNQHAQQKRRKFHHPGGSAAVFSTAFVVVDRVHKSFQGRLQLIRSADRSQSKLENPTRIDCNDMEQM